jgi:bacterioferritin-associated ferredoxin
MYVCICNALKDSQLEAAAADPAVKTSACVFKRCDARPQCGRCLPDVAEIISSVQITKGDTALDRG